MVLYPPVVSVAGFANVDRGMFRAVSNLTEEMECCKEQVGLILLRNIVKINLQICGSTYKFCNYNNKKITPSPLKLTASF